MLHIISKRKHIITALSAIQEVTPHNLCSDEASWQGTTRLMHVPHRPAVAMPLTETVLADAVVVNA